MTINILAFGVAKEILGSAQAGIAFREGMTVGDIKTSMENEYPEFKQLTSFAIAVNGEYAQPGQIIIPGDEVAIIPPVSGG